MNRVLCSPITKLVAFLVGYAAALSAVRGFSRSFDHYIRNILGDWLKIDKTISIVLFVLCLTLLIVSVWMSKDRTVPVWRRVDLILLAVLTCFAVMWCVYNAMNNYHYHEALLLLSAVTYTVTIAFIAEVTARVRDKKWGLLWPIFFKLYPLRRPMGLLMALLLAGNLLSVLVLRIWENTPLLLLLAFTLSALTYFCSFILSLSAEYDKANDEKVRAERFKAELITNVSHDIRTPLTSIINYVDLLKGLPVENTEFSEYVAVLDRKSTRLKTLIGDLMEASKAATGNVEVNLREIDLSEIVGQIAGEFDDQFNERNLTFVFRQLDKQVLAKADSGHLWRVLENLFGNAAKYALTGTRVFAEIGLHDGTAILSLKNTSQNPIDFPADSLTEQFIRGDRARQTDGNGLGLYIAKSLVEVMGGQFTVRASGDLFEAEIVFG